MKAVRVYKVNVKDNILRQQVFTDRNILIGLLFVITGLIFYFGKSLPFPVKLFGAVIIDGTIMLILSFKIDRQPAYEVLKRAIRFYFRQRKVRF